MNVDEHIKALEIAQKRGVEIDKLKSEFAELQKEIAALQAEVERLETENKMLRGLVERKGCPKQGEGVMASDYPKYFTQVCEVIDYAPEDVHEDEKKIMAKLLAKNILKHEIKTKKLKDRTEYRIEIALAPVDEFHRAIERKAEVERLKGMIHCSDCEGPVEDPHIDEYGEGPYCDDCQG